MTEILSAEHEELGRRVTRMIADYARALDSSPVCSKATPAEIEKLFDEPLPVEPRSAEEILTRFARDVMPHAMAIASPRYYGLFNPTPLALSVWVDALISAMNQNGAAWRNSPAANVIEARVVRWLCELIGYEEQSFGTLTSGGSEANLLALKCARDRAADGARDNGLAGRGAKTGGALIVYASDQCHYSFEKSIDILGMGRRNLRKIETDDFYHIKLDRLRDAIERDVQAGNTPVCIVGAGGATSTGIVDPLDALANIAREYKLWFHVDAAYGGALLFSERHRARLRGIEAADSVTIDPHKWMFVPFAAGACLVRDGARVLRDAFDITPEYIDEHRAATNRADMQFDGFRYGQLGTRRANSLKVWAAFQSLGTRGYERIIDRHIELTEHFARRIDDAKDFARTGRVETAVCCLRFLPERLRRASHIAQDRAQQTLQQRIERSGEAWLSTTVLKGARHLRVNINSFLTEERHIDNLIELLMRESATLMSEEKFYDE